VRHAHPTDHLQAGQLGAGRRRHARRAAEMTLVSLAPDDLGQVLTFITGFMCDHRSKSYKTYNQLLAIYQSCKDTLTPDNDKSEDLRITGFINDMTDGNWRDPNIVIELGVWRDRVLVVGGIHRGVSYLECLNNGVSPQDLPLLFLGY
jgi:hypothetical protein